MRKIIVGAMVSMDAAMRAPGRPSEDSTTGFKFGGRQMPFAINYLTHDGVMQSPGAFQ